MSELKRIAVITSGGDAPGMNAAVRAGVRTALGKGAEIVGVADGFRGLRGNERIEVHAKRVGVIARQGGAILHTARSPEFRSPEGRQQASENLLENDVQGLVVIGGDGSLSGAMRLDQEFHFPVMGIPGSIDNDISGTDFSIGFDTAVNTGVE